MSDFDPDFFKRMVEKAAAKHNVAAEIFNETEDHSGDVVYEDEVKTFDPPKPEFIAEVTRKCTFEILPLFLPRDEPFVANTQEEALQIAIALCKNQLAKPDRHVARANILVVSREERREQDDVALVAVVTLTRNGAEEDPS